MLKKLTVLTVVLALILCGTALAASPMKGGTLIFGRGGDSVGLDPAYETDGNSFMICDNIFEALVFYQDESTALEPGLAESWSISDDGLTYTFKLRKGVKFHDGTPFNANAVVFSIGRMMKNPNVKFIGQGWDIPAQERPPEYWVSMEMDETVGAIEAMDDHGSGEATLTLGAPVGPLRAEPNEDPLVSTTFTVGDYPTDITATGTLYAAASTPPISRIRTAIGVMSR